VTSSAVLGEQNILKTFSLVTYLLVPANSLVSLFAVKLFSCSYYTVVKFNKLR